MVKTFKRSAAVKNTLKKKPSAMGKPVYDYERIDLRSRSIKSVRGAEIMFTEKEYGNIKSTLDMITKVDADTEIPTELACTRCCKDGSKLPRSHFILQELVGKKQLDFVCVKCSDFLSDTPKKIICVICGEQPASAFSLCIQKEAKIGKRKQQKNFRCRDCQHPSCCNPYCSTCKVCGVQGCKKGTTCTQQKQPLHASAMPKDIKAKKQFQCDACLYPKCGGCTKLMDRNARSRFRTKSEWKPGELIRRSWTCGDCLTIQFEFFTLAKYAG